MAKPVSEVMLNERGYYDVGQGIKGARTDDELVEAIMDRKHDTVTTISAALLPSLGQFHNSTA